MGSNVRDAMKFLWGAVDGFSIFANKCNYLAATGVDHVRQIRGGNTDESGARQPDAGQQALLHPLAHRPVAYGEGLRRLDDREELRCVRRAGLEMQCRWASRGWDRGLW